MAGCQNDPTNSFDLSNDAGHSRGGENAILSNNQATNLGEEIHNTHFSISKSRATAWKHQNWQMDKGLLSIGPEKMFFNEHNSTVIMMTRQNIMIG